MRTLNRIEYETLLGTAARQLSRLRSDAASIEADAFRASKLRQAAQLVEIFDQLADHADAQAVRIAALEDEIRRLRHEQRPYQSRLRDSLRIGATDLKREQVRAESIRLELLRLENLCQDPDIIPSVGDVLAAMQKAI